MGNTRSRYRGYQPKNQASEDQAEKPKYDKNVDFFDSITNSSLEQKRGGYRGRGRGGFDRNRDDAFGGRENRGGRGGYDRNQRGRGGRNNDYDRGNRPNTGGFGEFRQNKGRKNLYSDKLADPNAVNFGKEEEKGEEGDKNSGFYDKSFKNAEEAVKAYDRQR